MVNLLLGVVILFQNIVHQGYSFDIRKYSCGVDKMHCNQVFFNLHDRGFEPMNPFTGLSLESSCFNHLHKRNVQLDIDIPSLYKFMSNFIQFRNLCPRTIGLCHILSSMNFTLVLYYRLQQHMYSPRIQDKVFQMENSTLIK